MRDFADQLGARGEKVHTLANIISSSNAVEYVAPAFITVMKAGAWQHWKNELGREVKPHDFKEFVETPYPAGLGTRVDVLKKFIEGSTEAVDLFDRAMQRKAGKTWDSRTTENTVDNVNSNRPTGNNEAYALRKLRKDAPEIHQQVIAGELSPHAGMVNAGFRRKTATIPIDVDSAIAAIHRHFDADQVRQIKEGL